MAHISWITLRKAIVYKKAETKLSIA
jgi:hypothetical protein